jgi:hypothetical protein
MILWNQAFGCRQLSKQCTNHCRAFDATPNYSTVEILGMKSHGPKVPLCFVTRPIFKRCFHCRQQSYRFAVYSDIKRRVQFWEVSSQPSTAAGCIALASRIVACGASRVVGAPNHTIEERLRRRIRGKRRVREKGMKHLRIKESVDGSWPRIYTLEEYLRRWPFSVRLFLS